MPKVNTFNYDTIASWNGSQDLFVVEQPDGTKVATPAMVKQFIEAGDFTATGEIGDGHGNKLSGVVDIIGDLSQTGLTGNSVTDQLTDAGEQITTKFTDGVYTSNNNEITITSEHRYDTIIVIGGFGSNTVFDVIFVNSSAGVLKLGNSGSTITSVDTYGFKYKAASEWFQGKIFSAHGAKLTVS